MKLKLYHAKWSLCSQMVRVAMEEKGLSYESNLIKLCDQYPEAENLSPEYLAINPKGIVPSLDLDGEIVTESTNIIKKLNSIETIAQELQKALEKNFNLFRINENELIKNYNSLLYKKNETSNFSANDMSKFQGKIIKVDLDGEITIRLSNKQLSKYSESEIKLII